VYIRSAMIAVDRALLSYHRLSAAMLTIPLSVAVCPQVTMKISTGDSDPLMCSYRMGPGPCPVHCYLGPHEYP